ncbi:MAG: tRNA preQ1(34) S-adenosylmethionine ribosyltransferase-isomerase QueA [Vulcanimicrobiaceae bacterium]
MRSGVAEPLRLASAYRYDLPETLLAKSPADPPESARLMVLDGERLEHRTFRDFPSLLRAGDVLALNETRVIRARLRATREPGGGAAEILLLRPLDRPRFDLDARRWEALVRPARRLRPGVRLRFGDDGSALVLAAGARGVRELQLDLHVPLDQFLERHGELPLPPYLGPGDEARAARYQTVFARVPGSIAAPTASLHFTPAALAEARARGVSIVPLVLDVGLGTFRPIESETLDEHRMHAERYQIPAETAAAVNAAKREGRRVVVAGTTALRALEASALRGGAVVAGEAQTDLFVTPGFEFRVADLLLTNFHLPQSTLLVLVSAFGGYEPVMRAYRAAIAEGYRFYSFGDAMLVSRIGPAQS